MGGKKIVSQISEFKLHEQAILLLCRRELDLYANEYTKTIFDNPSFDWDCFVGIAHNHRVAGIMYNRLKNYNNVPELVKRTFQLTYEYQVMRNIQHNHYINELFSSLEEKGIKYSFLKGAVLNSMYYKNGERASNDTDILVLPDELDNVIEVCEKLGYKQGEQKNGKVILATQGEKIFARLNTYELVPFVKVINNPSFPHHVVDINFRLGNDDKSESAAVLLKKTRIINKGKNKIRTLYIEELLVYLCIHLYREATMVYKIVSGSDMKLYKFADLHHLIEQEDYKISWKKVKAIAKMIGKEKAVYYSLYYTECLFPCTMYNLDSFSVEDKRFLNEYFGRDNSDEVYTWKMNFNKRFFNTPDRVCEALIHIENESNRYERIINELRDSEGEE